MQNRRNLYRLLHVQRDAPAAVIKSSYRTLMQTLRHHPDLGGDEWNAQLLNEARQTLCDPLARARYDADFPRPEADATAPAARKPEPAAQPSGVQDEPHAEPQADRPCCSYCRTPLAPSPARRRAYGSPDRCRRCGAPTREVVVIPRSSGTAERRGLHRVAAGGSVTLLRHWPDNVTASGTLLEYSSAGCSLESDTGFLPNEVVLLHSEIFTATGQIRSSEAIVERDTQRIGVRFLSLETHGSPGSLLSDSV